MYNRKKSDSPNNAYQIYVDGKRYRSISSAAADTEITFCHIVNKLAESNGGPIIIKGHKLVSESWLLYHPEEIIKIVEKAKNEQTRHANGVNLNSTSNPERRN